MIVLKKKLKYNLNCKAPEHERKQNKVYKFDLIGPILWSNDGDIAR